MLGILGQEIKKEYDTGGCAITTDCQRCEAPLWLTKIDVYEPRCYQQVCAVPAEQSLTDFPCSASLVLLDKCRRNICPGGFRFRR